MQAPAATQTLPLRDIKLPEDPGFWPLAPGWWALAVMLLVLLVWMAIKWRQYALKRRRWRDIEAQLNQLSFNYQKSHNKQKLLADVSVFLRRFVKYQLHQDHAATLCGDDWIKHLHQQQNQQPFKPFELALSQGVYQSECDYDADGLLKTTQEFIKQQVMKPPKGASHV